MKDKKLSRKKHKRLDAIYERESSRSRREVEVIEASDCKDGGDEVDLRRSSRARKAPVLLDTSPSPAKKRRKTGKGSGLSNVEHGKGEDGINIELDGYDSRDAEVGDDGWRARLRSRGRGGGFKVRGLEVSSPRGKRKLFEHSDLMNEESVSVDGDVEKQKPEVVGEGTTVVKSKRPGRVKASNFLGNQSPEIELGGSADDDKEESVEREVLEVKVQGDQSIVSGIECDIDNNGDDGNTPPPSVEIIEGETKVDIQLEKCPGPSDMSNSAIEASVQLEDCQRLYQLGDAGQYIQAEVGTCSVGGDLSNAVKINESNGDCNKDKGDSDKPLETQTFKKLRKKHYHSDDKHEKVQIKEGRRCGLCGTGSDGRPPKKLVQDGAGSDNEAYSGSSSAEEPNYDMLDGFGDEPGWVGRLLGPINDRHGIAGIFVHQQCAVWSPEVYFAGLGCLKNVRAALCRGRVLKCTRCGRPGATIGCRVDRCPRTYHLPCARANNCIFDHRKFLIACTDHRYLFQPHGNQNGNYLKKLERKKIKLELRKNSNDACRKDVEAEEKWLENCGEDEEFLKRESKRLHRDLLRIAPTYIGGSSGKQDAKIEGWESVAGLQSVIQCLKEVVILPLLYPEYFENLGLMPPRGVLLHGYPGTGKTLVVRALIGSCARGDKKIAYFARKGADCLGKYVGDAERQLRLLFQVAEKSQPSIIFFDEIDGLAPCRTPQQDQTHSSVVSTLLALMDGLKSRGSVIVIGATNRPDAIDPALRRPGRFDREIYFPLPSVDDREAILSLHTRNWPKPISGSILKRIARKTVGFAGADIQALCTQAAIIALRRSFPLQRILSEAADKAINGQRPPLPFVVVQERDWLEAFSCAAPPCSRREVGCASNELLSSPLPMYLESCLLQPLSRMLISLYLDERVWLPRPLSKAASCIEKVIVAALGKRKVKRDNWWSHATDMLEEAHIRSQIEDGLRNVGIIEGGTCSSSYAILEDNGDGRPEMELSGMQCARPGLLHNASYASSKKSGFRLLISGNPKSGQRHLASCLLHYFLGNVEVQKIDLAAISHQGHGDVVQGLQQVLKQKIRQLHMGLTFVTIDNGSDQFL
ncbi:hypothetical protein Leryth_015916 [Lithospermum erythrorhizon]|nr:hypothetical protein Leryth_015916 [Lithospermum erythrorhizon]